MPGLLNSLNTNLSQGNQMGQPQASAMGQPPQIPPDLMMQIMRARGMMGGGQGLANSMPQTVPQPPQVLQQPSQPIQPPYPMTPMQPGQMAMQGATNKDGPIPPMSGPYSNPTNLIGGLPLNPYQNQMPSGPQSSQPTNPNDQSGMAPDLLRRQMFNHYLNLYGGAA